MGEMVNAGKRRGLRAVGIAAAALSLVGVLLLLQTGSSARFTPVNSEAEAVERIVKLQSPSLGAFGDYVISRYRGVCPAASKELFSFWTLSEGPGDYLGDGTTGMVYTVLIRRRGYKGTTCGLYADIAVGTVLQDGRVFASNHHRQRQTEWLAAFLKSRGEEGVAVHP